MSAEEFLKDVMPVNQQDEEITDEQKAQAWQEYELNLLAMELLT